MSFGDRTDERLLDEIIRPVGVPREHPGVPPEPRPAPEILVACMRGGKDNGLQPTSRLSNPTPRPPERRNSAPQTMFYLEEGTQAEITMNRQSDRDRIAEEAVGQRHGSAPPYAEGKAGMSQE